MLVVVVLTGVIMIGLNQMMSDDDEEDGEEAGGEDR
jgi:hypothetical protein